MSFYQSIDYQSSGKSGLLSRVWYRNWEGICHFTVEPQFLKDFFSIFVLYDTLQWRDNMQFYLVSNEIERNNALKTTHSLKSTTQGYNFYSRNPFSAIMVVFTFKHKINASRAENDNKVCRIWLLNYKNPSVTKTSILRAIVLYLRYPFRNHINLKMSLLHLLWFMCSIYSIMITRWAW